MSFAEPGHALLDSTEWGDFEAEAELAACCLPHVCSALGNAPNSQGKQFLSAMEPWPHKNTDEE